MGHSLLCMMGFFLLSTVICGNAEDHSYDSQDADESGYQSKEQRTSAPPKLTVFLQPSKTQLYSGVIYRGETVTVRCEIQGGEGAQWTYEWSRGQVIIRETSSEYTFSSATQSDAGGYSCRGRRGSSWTEWSDIITLTVLPPPKPTVTLQPSWTQIYRGETVTVRCEIHGGEGAQWTYEWRRGQLKLNEISSEYTINRVTESDGGGYRCQGRRSSSWTEWSNITALTVSSPPKPTVFLQHNWPQINSGEINRGETVTVRCEIHGGEGAQWTYEWRRGQSSIRETSSEYTISRATWSDRGGYSCRGRRGSFWTVWSDIITMTILSPPKPTVTLQPSRTQINIGETVTVRCVIQGGERAPWTYEWRRGQKNIHETSSEYRISRLTESHGGGYSCRATRSSSWTEWSDITTLRVTAKPKAELRADRTAVPVGGSVTLTCSVNPSSSSSSGWKYYWYSDGKSYEPVRNEQISVSEGGVYSCRGGRGEPVYYTEDSESVRIDTTVSNRPVVTLYPNWSEIYRGETITVRCEIHGGDTEWDYEWETNSIIKAPNQNEYRIRSASSSNSGNYRCKGRMKSSQYETTEWSDSVTLTVSHMKPKAELRAVPVGGSVTLTCSVSPSSSSSSSGWKYYWYSDGKSYEPVRNEQISVSDGGLYWCKGGRGEPVYYTEDSEAVRIDKIVSNRPVVTLYPNWSEIYRGETITVRCEIHGGDTEWDYEWETNSIKKPPNQNEYKIKSASSSNSGNYRCKGRMKSSQYETTEWSDSVTLTVSHMKPKAELRADRTVVPVGGSVTLTCSVNPSSSSSSGWKYYWYSDGKSYEPVRNEQINVSDGGLYWCKGGRGEPVYYTEDSEAVRIDKIVSNRPVVTLYPNWSEIYRGETITVRCEIHGGDTEWDYEWEINSIKKPPNQNEYKIKSASSSNSGNYRCKGRMKSSQYKTTEWSDSVTLTVSDSKSYLL
ncbi:leukocyte immunoglobulin-like receptor subfamily B member 3A [Oreochromis niloticus]|uniref:leukocyte immunoglobulin-like receptor subfamily B member 3A n=1 Tax=Oreochromis niloticus TaxID=8128 RepID=UPI000DF47DCA|nr:leukocyte immunoglobulin-like receptor subfamily B member 3A [Oreochromis niloticus]